MFDCEKKMKLKNKNKKHTEIERENPPSPEAGKKPLGGAFITP